MKAIKMNPVCKKELKISVRNIRMFFVIFGYNALLAMIGLTFFYFNFARDNYMSFFNYTDVLQVYLILAMIEFALVVFAVPAYTAGTISGEREKQTLEILLTTKLKPWEIVVGKLMSSIASTLLLIVSSLPVLSIVFGIGGVHMADLLQLMLLCTVTAVFIGSIGIFFSALFKKTVPATVVTYITAIALIVGTIAIVMLCNIVITKNYDTQYYAAEGNTAPYSPPGVGNLILILLINPVVTLGSTLTRQIGTTGTITDVFASVGSPPDFFYNHWFLLSSILQLIVAGILLYIAAVRLNPMKKRKGNMLLWHKNKSS